MTKNELMLATMTRIFAAIALSFVVIAQGNAADDGTAGAVPPDNLPSFAPILKKITPAVAKVEIRGRAAAAGTNPRRRETREIHEVGSGVVYDASQGLIITNHHVIDHAVWRLQQTGGGRYRARHRLSGEPRPVGDFGDCQWTPPDQYRDRAARELHPNRCGGLSGKFRRGACRH